MNDDVTDSNADVSSIKSRSVSAWKRPWRVTTVVVVALVLIVATWVALAVGSSPSNHDPGSTGSATHSPWSDRMPAGIKLVDKGYQEGTGSHGEPLDTVGMVFKNTTEHLVILRVDYAVWDNSGDKDPWWKGPKTGTWPIFIAVGPHQKIGTGDSFLADKEDHGVHISHLQVRATAYSKDTYKGEPVSSSSFTARDQSSTLAATPISFGSGQEITFKVHNPYQKDVASVGVGLVLRDSKGNVAGGWTFRPNNYTDPNGTKFKPGKYPSGDSIHHIAIPGLALSWDLNVKSVEIYMWPRG